MQESALNLGVHTVDLTVLSSKESALSKSTNKNQKHTTGGIPRWSPTLVLVARFSAYVWQSGRDAQFSLTYGRMCLLAAEFALLFSFFHFRRLALGRSIETGQSERVVAAKQATSKLPRTPRSARNTPNTVRP